MYCHFVPQTYQKAWHSKNGKSNVIYFNKNAFNCPIYNNGGNINKNFGIENLYVFSNDDFNNGMKKINEKALENSFDKYLENFWQSVLTGISEMIDFVKKSGANNNIIAIKKEDVDTKLVNNLLNFIIIQFLRIKDNFALVDNGKIKELLSMCRQTYSSLTNISESDIEDLSKNKIFYDSCWKSILLDCFNKNSQNTLSLIKSKLIDKVSFVVFYADNAFDELILSDNPVIWNVGTKKKYDDFESGVFMPINPKALIALLPFDDNSTPKSGDFLFLKAKGNFYKYINYLLNDNSNKYIGFHSNQISQYIVKLFDKEKDWNAMFK